ncbi:hypothetical protein [Rheinheimera maricola]|uniref:HDOD domain-containing protein n=1 Tax=Rheinheimera maricola TaxID=2793282 RepID=A0ABS7XBC5_9GAMM|nr:hypothetical protein [Rheinheimera maricola]MBZ9612866.1 hypothetical protein [Rheinheimera maricola]
MTTEQNTWPHYLSLYQDSVAELTVAPTAARLFKVAVNLTKQRLALAQSTTLATLTDCTTPLPAAVWQTELLLYYADFYSLSMPNRQPLLLAGWCSALFAPAHSLTAGQTKVPRAMLLASAQYLASYPAAQSISRLLGRSYPAERKLPMWRQDLLSLLLTEVDYLRQANAGKLQQQLAQRLMFSSSEYELALLRPLLQQPEPQWFTANQPDNLASTVIEQLIQQSTYQQLSLADNRTVEQKLSKHPETASTVLAIASKLNRQHQHVDSIRLALGIIGRDNLSAVLAHAELNSYLSGLRHPWQQVFSQFGACLAQALLLSLPQPISAITCQLLASCIIAPLWQDDTYPRSALISQRPKQFIFRFTPQTTLQSSACLAQIIALLQLYQLPQYLDAVCQWHQHIEQQTSAALTPPSEALHRAWHCSLLLFCDPASTTSASLQPQTNNSIALDNSVLLQQLAELSQCHIPLQLSL